jgi:transcriptional antiterminator RfaH
MKNNAWYLIRTRQHKEPLVHATLLNHATESFLPLLRDKQVWWGKESSQLVPLFPGYVFAHFDIQTSLYSIQRTHGVVGVICAGSEPCEVPEFVIHEIKERQRNGIIELPDKAYRSGQKVQIIGGPLMGIKAVFEKYLSGADRVAVILKLIGELDVRAVLPSHRIRNVDA